MKQPDHPEQTSPSFGDVLSLGWIRLKRWALARHPGLLWGTQKLVLGYPEPEINLLPHLCRRDAVTVDVGANFGMWSFYALPHSRSLLSFEPLPPISCALSRGFRKWGARMQVEPVALSAEAGTARITMPRLHPGYSTIEPDNCLNGKVSTSFGWSGFDVQVRTLDSYALDQVGFVKVDAEGHEVSVLLGARDTIARCKPALVVETEERHKTGAVDAVSRFAAELGYRRYFLQDRALHRGEAFTVATHQDPERRDQYVRNLIFLQEPHVAALRAARDRLPFSTAALD